MSNLTEWLTQSQEQFTRLGWMGVLGYAFIIMVVQVFCTPLSPLAMMGGMIFGFGRGYAAITLGTAGGAVVNFLLSRYILREPILRRLARSEKFRLIDQAIGQEGGRIVFLLRFCPIPFGFANYCFGLTAIPLIPYWIATVVAVVPANAFLTYIGVTTRAGLDAAAGGSHRHPMEYVFMAVGILAFFFALRHVARVARQALAKRELEIAIEGS
ncbi:MAG: VTT domain-containing protein [Chthoniobacteraceae bacterium]